MKIYYELGNNQEFQSKFITSRVERRFWKFYNRSNYGWKFMGSYYHPRSYYEGVTRAKSNPTLGESFMAGVKPAARLTKSLFDPLYKKQNRKKLAKTSLAIDCINKKAKRAIIRPEDKSNLDDFDQFKYESSYDYRKKGDRDYDDGFYDQSRYESYYEDYYL